MLKSTLSSCFCTFLYNGMLASRMAKTTIRSAGMVTAKGRAARKSTVKAMTMAPITTKGERRNRRRNILIPFCTWLTSLVIRLIRVEVPMESISGKEKAFM